MGVFCKAIWMDLCVCERGKLSQESYVWALDSRHIGYNLGSSAWNLGEGRGPRGIWELPSGSHVHADSKLQLS